MCTGILTSFVLTKPNLQLGTNPVRYWDKSPNFFFAQDIELEDPVYFFFMFS